MQFTYSSAFFKIRVLTKQLIFRIIFTNILETNLLEAKNMISVSLFILVLISALILIESQIAVGRQKEYVKVEERRKKR